MKKIIIMLIISNLFSCQNWDKKKLEKKDIFSEMNRLNIDTVLVVSSNAIDEYPLWSPDSNYIAANIMGKWYKFVLKDVNLVEAKWHNISIGALSRQDAKPLLENEYKIFNQISKNSGRTIIQGDVKVQLDLKDFATSLIITKGKQKSYTVWKSGLENCHSLVLSPNKNYVAYLCELNGLFIMRIK